ncbi:MAG: phospholipid carrier-dependent glycosyltransferase [bacterium]|nr:phospholipid carrier-dependent glycosyltransferase [bacterium]
MADLNPSPAPAPAPEPAETPPKGRLFALLPFAAVAIVGLSILLPALGQYGLWDPWEPKYSQSAREMVERGSYIVPYYRGDIRLTKPILAYWGILSGYAVLGMNELGARLPGVLLAVATMLATLYSVSLLRGRRAGLISALVLGTTPYFYFISRQAMPDVYLFTSYGCAMLFFCLGLFGPDRRRQLHFGISYACLGLAVMAKGPMIVGILFFATLAIFAFLRIDPRVPVAPGIRKESLQLTVSLALAAAASGFGGFLAFLFLLGENWWGYSAEKRSEMAFVRHQIENTAARFHLTEIVLVALIAALVALAVLALRATGSPLKRRVVPALSAIGALVALVTLVAAGSETKIGVAAVLSMVAMLGIAGGTTWRYVQLETIAPHVLPLLRPIGRQIVLAAIVLTVVAGPWHIAVVLAQGDGYFTDFILKHNVNRAGEKINRAGVSDFYLRVMIFGFFPWVCFLPVALGRLVAWWDERPLRRFGFEIYLLINAAVIFVAFSGSVTKFPHYLSPMIVPATVLAGLTLDRMLRDPDSKLTRVGAVAACMLYLPPMLDLVRYDGIERLIGSFTMKSAVSSSMAPGAPYSALLYAGAVAMFALILVRSRIVVGALIACMLAFSIYMTGAFTPRLSEHKSMKLLVESWEDLRRPGEPIGFFGDTKHGTFFYTNREIQHMANARRLERFLRPENPAFVIMQRKRLDEIETRWRTRYPDNPLYEVNDSHLSYVTVANYPVAENNGEPQLLFPPEEKKYGEE